MNQDNIELKEALAEIGIKIQRLEEPESFEPYTYEFCKSTLYQMQFWNLHHWTDRSNDWYALYVLYTFFNTEPTTIYLKEVELNLYKK